MQDVIQLFRQLAVDFGDDRLDGTNGILRDEAGLRERLFSQGMDGAFDGLLRPLRLGLEFLLEQPCEFVFGQRGGFLAGFLGGAGFGFCHDGILLSPIAFLRPRLPPGAWVRKPAISGARGR